MLTEIANIITEEVARKELTSFAENLRAAAWYAIEEFPAVTASVFGDAAVLAGLHRQGAINRFNEAKKNLEIAG